MALNRLSTAALMVSLFAEFLTNLAIKRHNAAYRAFSENSVGKLGRAQHGLRERLHGELGSPFHGFPQRLALGFRI